MIKNFIVNNVKAMTYESYVEMEVKTQIELEIKQKSTMKAMFSKKRSQDMSDKENVFHEH